jgi:hypothetical protein
MAAYALASGRQISELVVQALASGAMQAIFEEAKVPEGNGHDLGRTGQRVRMRGPCRTGWSRASAS